MSNCLGHNMTGPGIVVPTVKLRRAPISGAFLAAVCPFPSASRARPHDTR
jgi:hypothetical protein